MKEFTGQAGSSSIASELNSEGTLKAHFPLQTP
jgi:hypothetical protein